MKSKFEIPLREDIAFDLQVFCRDNFDRLKRIHRHFIKEIESYASLDHIDLLRCLRMMSNSYQILILEFMDYCELNELAQLGRFTMKVFLQLISSLKWVTKTFLKKTPKFQSNIVSMNQPEEKVEVKEPNSEQFYRMKENSLFMANELKHQIYKLVENLSLENEQLQKCIEQILAKKDKIQTIQENNNQLLLVEAVNMINNKSQTFHNFIQMTQENFQSHLSNFKVQPFSLIKNQANAQSAKRVKVAQNKINDVFTKLIKKYTVKKVPNTSCVACQISQESKNYQILEKECKFRGQKIRKLERQLSYERDRNFKLQMLIREKAQQLEVQATKFREQEQKKSTKEKKVHIREEPQIFQEELGKKQDYKMDKISISCKSGAVRRIGRKSIAMKFTPPIDSQKMQSKQQLKKQILDIYQGYRLKVSPKKQEKQKTLNQAIQCNIPKKMKNITINQNILSYIFFRPVQKKKFESARLSQKRFGRKESLINIINIGATSNTVRNSSAKKFFGIDSEKTKYFQNSHEVISDRTEAILHRQSIGPQTETLPQENQNPPLLVIDENSAGDNNHLFTSKTSVQNKNNFEKLPLSSSTCSMKRKSPFSMIIQHMKQNNEKKYQYKINVPQKIQKIDATDIELLYFSSDKAFQAQFLCDTAKNFKVMTHSRQNSKQIGKKQVYCEQKKLMKGWFYLIQHLRIKSPETYKDIKQFIRSPYSSVFQKDKRQKKKFKVHKNTLSYPEFQCIIQRILNLHTSCEGFPCEHIKIFLHKFGLIFE